MRGLQDVGKSWLNAGCMVLVFALIIFIFSPFVAPCLADETRIIAHVGDALPGGDGNSVNPTGFTGFTNAYNPAISDSGHVIFTAQFSGAGVIATGAGINNRAIYRGNPNGTVELIGRLGAGAWAPSGNLNFTSLSSPMINDAGQFLFQASLAGTGVTSSNSQSYWGVTSGTPQLVARAGDTAQGLPSNISLGLLSQPQFFFGTGNSKLNFNAALIGAGLTTANNRALFQDGLTSGASQMQVRAGSSIVEFPSLTVKDPYRITNAAGDDLLYATLMGAGIVTNGSGAIPNDQIIWKPGANSYIARAGDLAPGTDGLRFSSVFAANTIRQPRINARGHIAFSATLIDNLGNAVGAGIWSDRSGVLAPVVLSGDIVDGVSILSPLSSVVSVGYRIADDDSVIFQAMLTGAGVSTESDRAVIKSDSSGHKSIMLRGAQQAPGLPLGILIKNISVARTWSINTSGDAAFAAELAGPGVDATNDMSIVSNISGRPLLAAREGDTPPNSGNWRIWSLLAEPALYFNDAGQILFSAQADGGPNGSGGTGGWWRVDATNHVRPLMLGTEIVPGQIGPRIRLNSISTYALMSFNNAGEVSVVSNLMNGGDVTGESIVVFKIVDEPTGGQRTGDFNGDGAISVQDIFDFLAAWFTQDSRADFNHASGVTVQDLFDFLAVWFEGC